MNKINSKYIEKILRERRLDMEDFLIQLDAAKRSAERGYYATSIAELNGAIIILEAMQRRSGEK